MEFEKFAASGRFKGEGEGEGRSGCAGDCEEMTRNECKHVPDLSFLVPQTQLYLRAFDASFAIAAGGTDSLRSFKMHSWSFVF